MSTERPFFVAHALCPPHLRKQVEDVSYHSVIAYLANITYSTPVKLACRYLALFSILDGG